MKKMTNKKYVKKGGIRCPNCGSRNLMWEAIHITTKEGGCLDCNASWTEFYRLAGYKHLEIQDD